MKKILYTLNLGYGTVNEYQPEITQMTYPLMRRWAKKIEAEIFIIKDRKFPDFPPVYEKLQIHTLAEEHDADVIYYLDSDTLVHPDFFDPINHIPRGHVAHYGNDMAGNRFRYDKYFRRDSRHIGSCNWCTIAHRDCLDLWRPLDISLEEAVANIFPVHGEAVTGFVEPSHLIDDYTLSRNIARFGLKYISLLEIIDKLKCGSGWLWHLYNIPNDMKARMMYELISNPLLPSGQEPEKGKKYGWGLIQVEKKPKIEYEKFCIDHKLKLEDGYCPNCIDEDGKHFVLDMQSIYLEPKEK